MGILTIVKKVKEIHPDYVTIVNIGKFYYTYGKDSYIVSYLLGYKLNMYEDVSRCGFTDNSINKVMAKLEQNKINYLLLDRKNNYDVDKKFDNKNLNSYDKIFKKAKDKIYTIKRIDAINSYLYANADNKEIGEILNRMEEVLNEGRKV